MYSFMPFNNFGQLISSVYLFFKTNKQKPILYFQSSISILFYESGNKDDKASNRERENFAYSKTTAQSFFFFCQKQSFNNFN